MKRLLAGSIIGDSIGTHIYCLPSYLQFKAVFGYIGTTINYCHHQYCPLNNPLPRHGIFVGRTNSSLGTRIFFSLNLKENLLKPAMRMEDSKCNRELTLLRDFTKNIIHLCECLFTIID